MDAITRVATTTPAALTPPAAGAGAPWTRITIMPIDGTVWVNVQGGVAAVGTASQTAPGSVAVPALGFLRLPYGAPSTRSESGDVLVNVIASTTAEE